MALEIRSEPASTLGQNQNVGTSSALTASSVSVTCSSASSYSRADRVLHHHQVTCSGIEASTDTPVMIERVKRLGAIGRHPRCQVNRRTTSHVDRARIFTHLDQPRARAFRGDQVKIRKLGDSMAYFFINRSGHLATLHVRDRDILVSSGDRSGQRLVSVRHRDDHIGVQVVEDRGQLHHAVAGGLGGGDQVLSLHHHVDHRVRLEAIVDRRTREAARCDQVRHRSAVQHSPARSVHEYCTNRE